MQAGRITIDTTGSVSNQAGSMVSDADLSIRATSLDNASAGIVRAGKVKQEYDLKSAVNTGELKRSSLIEKQYLERTRGDLEQLLLDPKVSEETKQQARRSIKELSTAINVIDKAPVIRDAAELGLIAVDVATLGEFAAARVLTSSVVKEVVLRRTGTALSDEAAARVANNFYRDGVESPQALATTSGAIIQANPTKTTTVLGTFRDDMDSIINQQIGAPKLPDFAAPKTGGFNVLNVPDEVFAQMNASGPTAFWENVNRPFLDSAIARGDEIYLATTPDATRPWNIFKPDGSLTGFGREVQYLQSKGYVYHAATGKMVKS